MAGYTRQSVADIVNGANITAPPLNAEFNTLAAAFNGTTGHTHTGGTGDGPKIELTTSVSGYLPQVHGGVGGKNNTQATVNPTSSNDVNSGYAPGSVWINANTGRLFVCIVNSASSAVWVEAMGITPFNQITPENDNTVDIGSPAYQFKDLYINGTGYIDAVSGDTLTLTGNSSVGGQLTVTGATLGSSLTLTGNASVGGLLAVTGNTTIAGNTSLNGNTVIGNTTTDTVNVNATISTDLVPTTDNSRDLGTATNEWRNLYLTGTANIDSLVADTADINAGSIDNTPIGAGTQSTAAFTGLTVSSTATFSGATISNLGSVTTADINGGTIDGVSIGQTTAATAVSVDNLKLDGNAIISTNTNGNIDLTPNGTGEVNITKVDIDSGAIDGTVIGANSHTTGKFTTVQTTGTATLASVNIDGGSIDGTSIGSSTTSTGAFTTVSASGGFTGALAGNVTGNVTGNLTGNVTGDVTGNVSGNITSTGSSSFNNVAISGTLNMDANTTATIQNLTDPTNLQDAATKNYVDTSIANLIDGAPATLDTLNELAAALADDANAYTTLDNKINTKVSKAGDTMTGDLDMGANKVTTTTNPTTDSELSRKGYVDAQDALKVSKAGDTMTGALAMSSNKVTGVADPTDAQDVATKNYIDTVFGSTQSAAASAAAALLSEQNAATSESNAATSESNAAQSLADTQAVYDQFDDRYLGSKTSAPTVDNDGNALLIGALYFNETTGSMQVYSSSGWVPAGSSVNGTSARFKYVATANQNTFSGADANGEVLAYDSGYLDVFLNGVRLSNGDDFTATSGTSIQLLFNASENDVLEIVGYGTFQLADIHINDMVDVNIAGVTEGQVLKYNSTTQIFEPGDADILDNTVSTAKVQNAAITQAKLADNSVGSAQIIDGSVNDAEIGTVNATAIDYDNTVSGISGNTVQEAIDYLNTLSGGSSGDVASYTRDKFVATAGQTTFTTSNGYTLGYLQVFVNGILLDITDYTANDESTIVLTEAADAGDEVVAIALDSFAIAELLRVTSVSASAADDTLTIDAFSNLNVANNVNAKNLTLQATIPDLAFVSPDGTSNQYYIGANISDSVDGGLQIGTGTSVNGGTEILTVRSSGNVGIGTSSPEANIHIRNGSGNCDSILAQYGTGTKAKISAYSNSADLRAYNGATKLTLSRPDGNNSLVVNTNGEITTPHQPSFRAYNNGTITSTGTTVWNAVVHNVGGHYNNSTGQFTAPVSGSYQFNISWVLNDLTSYFWGQLQRNGSTINADFHTTDATTSYQGRSISHTVYLNAGDTFSVYVGGMGGGSIQTVRSSISGHLVG